MPALAVQVPRIRQESATSARVTQWGHVGAFVLRAGDRLVLAEPTPGALLLLVPRGWGNPMLGRQRGATLIAEPGGVPASAARWQVAGRIVAIERDLERAVVGGGRWAVSVVFHPTRAATVGQLRDAELRFQGGWMDGAQLDAFCLQAALAADDLGVEISVGAAEDFEAADSLAALASPGTVRIYERLSSDTHGGFDSDLAAYSSEGQYREYAVSTCTDSLFSLYGADMERLPLDAEIKGRLSARLDEIRPSFPPVERIEVWDRYRIAAEMYRVLGRDPVFIGDLLHRASWTARDRAVGIFEGLSGPIAARLMLDQGQTELAKNLDPHQRKILLHNLARVAHRGGWSEERDQLLAAFAAVGDLSPKEAEVLATFKQAAQVVEPALQDEAIAAYRSALAQPSLAMDEKVRVTFVLADLLRRRGRYSEAQPLFARVMVERGAPLNLREMAGFLSRDIVERHPSATPTGSKPG